MRAVIALVLLSFFCANASAQSNWFRPQVERMDDGLQLLTDRQALGLSSVKVIVYAGSINEAPQFRGIARVTANALINPVLTSSLPESISGLQSRLHRIGASVSVEVGLEASVFSLDAPKEGVIEALKLLLLNLSSPSLAFARIRSESVVQARRVLGPGKVALSDRLSTYLYEHEGVSLLDPVQTSSESIDADALRHFYNRHYRPDRMMVVATGDFQRAELRRAVINHLLLPVPDVENEFMTHTSTRVLAAPSFPLKLSGLGRPRQLILGFAACPAFGDNAPACVVLGEILRASVEARLQDKFGSSVGVDGGYVALARDGFFALRVRAGKWGGVTGLLREEVKNIKQRIDAKAIKNAIRALDLQMAWRRAHPWQLSAYYVQLLLTGRRDPIDFESFENEIRSSSEVLLQQLAESFGAEATSFSIRLTPVLR